VKEQGCAGLVREEREVVVWPDKSMERERRIVVPLDRATREIRVVAPLDGESD
jgi:hypothetical protein